jgi:hypothetical protein
MEAGLEGDLELLTSKLPSPSPSPTKTTVLALEYAQGEACFWTSLLQSLRPQSKPALWVPDQPVSLSFVPNSLAQKTGRDWWPLAFDFRANLVIKGPWTSGSTSVNVESEPQGVLLSNPYCHCWKGAKLSPSHRGLSNPYMVRGLARVITAALVGSRAWCLPAEGPG